MSYAFVLCDYVVKIGWRQKTTLKAFSRFGINRCRARERNGRLNDILFNICQYRYFQSFVINFMTKRWIDNTRRILDRFIIFKGPLDIFGFESQLREHLLRQKVTRPHLFDTVYKPPSDKM